MENDGKNPAAVALGRLGGLRGGVARAEKLTKERRHEIAQAAAQKRWAKPDLDRPTQDRHTVPDLSALQNSAALSHAIAGEIEGYGTMAGALRRLANARADDFLRMIDRTNNHAVAAE